MRKFRNETIRAMRSVLEEVCSHVPATANSTRTFVASRLLECASMGEESYDGLLAAGRRAVLEQFDNTGALASWR